MKVVKGQSEGGILVGNTYDKYNTRNPIARYLVRGFSDALTSLVEESGKSEIHEVGCGEGYWTLKWQTEGKQARGSDFSSIAIGLARENAEARGLTDRFMVEDIYRLSPDRDSAPLVVCCEVLEHLEWPDRALEVLQSLARPYLIVSVPREPMWSAMNMARGRYWSDWGNTPGHIQRWSRSDFLGLLSNYVEIVKVRSPLPWTMALCRVR